MGQSAVSTSFRRSYGHSLRCQARGYVAPRFQLHRVASGDSLVLDVVDLPDILMTEFKSCCLLCGGWVVAWDQGMVQGSSFAPGVCLTVAAYLGHDSCNLPFARRPAIRIVFSLMRWVDDALMCVVVSLKEK